MAFSPGFIDELIAQNPIEDVVGQYVNLKRSGANREKTLFQISI